jgi:hypothetical protein
MLHVPLAQREQTVTYNINHGQQLEFVVPGRNQNMRWASYSVCIFLCNLHSLISQHTQCNGFSAGVNHDDFRGPGFRSGYDPCWTDLLAKHAEEPFHVLVGGGDQLYCDGQAFHLQTYISRLIENMPQTNKGTRASGMGVSHDSGGKERIPSN